MKGVHPHIWKFLCIFLVTAILTSILFRFSGKKQPSIPDQHTRQPVVCITEDSQDTAFKKAVKENETLYLPSKSTLVTLTREEMAMFYHRYINNIQYFCKSKLRLGKVGNGGWDVCDEAQYRPKQPCLIYSFGVGDYFSFDDAVIEKYGCEVHSFDTRMGTKSYQRKNSDYFHAFGVAATKKINDDGTELLTYTSIQQKLKHTERKISLLKLAIESLEWEVLDSMLDSGQLSDTNSLAVEFHLERSSSETDVNTYTQALLVLKKLYDAGFRIFWTRQNGLCRFQSACTKEWRTNCHKVSFVRVRS